MERDRNAKILAVIALTVAVIGLSIGFAAFSQTLTIKSSADVKPDETEFTSNVKFTTEAGLAEGTVTATNEGATSEDANLTATVIQDIKVHFTKPGQSSTYKFKVKNESPYDAYLRSVTFKNADGGATPIKCTKVTHPEEEEKDALDSDVTAACTGIKVTVTVGGESYSESNATISAHKLAKTTGEEEASVKIEYEAGSGVADGDFTVAIGDIELTYASRDKTA